MREKIITDLNRGFKIFARSKVCKARSETHDMAHIRLRRDDVKAIEEGTSCTKIVGLFSTNNSKEPVFLRSLETLFVQLPNTEIGVNIALWLQNIESNWAWEHEFAERHLKQPNPSESVSCQCPLHWLQLSTTTTADIRRVHPCG